MLGDHIQQVLVQIAVACHDLTVVGVKSLAAEIAHGTAGFRNQQRAGGYVPRSDAPFPVSVEPARGDVTEVEGRRAGLPDRFRKSRQVSACWARRAKSYEKPVARSEAIRSAVRETAIGVPLRVAPPPRRAAKSSSRIGS